MFAAVLPMMLTVGVMVDALMTMTMMTTELAIGVVVSGKYCYWKSCAMVATGRNGRCGRLGNGMKS